MNFYFRFGAFIHKDEILHLIGYNDKNETVVISILDLENKNPYGFEAAFYRFTGITTPFMHIINATRVADRHFSVSYKDILESEPKDIAPWYHSSMFWDCETYTPFKDFTMSERKEDLMISISVVFTNLNRKKGFLLLNNWGSLAPMSSKSLFENSEPYEISTINYKDEEDMIRGFWELIVNHKPQYVVDFNGKSYDIPYLLTRMKRYNISVPVISPIGTPSQSLIERHFVFGQGKDINYIKSDGILFVDLMHHMKLWFELTPNHKLDTFSRFYLGEGKTGLTIAELFKAYEDKDAKALVKGAKYSMRDAIVLEEIWEKISYTIELSSSSLGINPDEITTFQSTKSICSRLFWTCNIPFKFEAGKKLKSSLVNGAYKNVLVYTYLPKILSDISQIKESWIPILLKRLRNVPTGIISSVYEALMTKGLIDRTKFLDFIKLIRRNRNKIIYYGKGVIFSMGKIENDNVNQIDFFEGYINLPIIGKIIKRSNGDIKYFSNLAKSECPLIKKLFEQVFLLLMRDIDKIEEPVLEELPLSDFIYSKSVRYDSAFKELYLEGVSRTKEIMKSYGYKPEKMIIPESFPIKWVVTSNGAMLYESGMTYELDYYHYSSSWRKIYKAINA